MRINGKQVKQIQEALLDAYPTRDELRMMIRMGFDEHLEAIADGNNMRVVAFNLVTWAEQYGRLDELIQLAHDFNPGNASMQRLVETVGSPLRLQFPKEPPAFETVVPRNAQPASIDVFLSYSRRDSETMRLVRETLRATGLGVWTDEGLEPGTASWRATIEEAIKQSKAMVVLLSPSAYTSVWVDNEVAFAQALNKRVFPILVSGEPSYSGPMNLDSVKGWNKVPSRHAQTESVAANGKLSTRLSFFKRQFIAAGVSGKTGLSLLFQAIPLVPPPKPPFHIQLLEQLRLLAPPRNRLVPGPVVIVDAANL